MTVHLVLPTMIQHKEDVEDLVQTVVTAWCGLPFLPAVPVHRDASAVQVTEEESRLQQRTLEERSGGGESR